MPGRCLSPPSAIGRPPEVTNACFVDAKRERTGPGHRAALEQTDGRQWVGSSSSLEAKPAVRERAGGNGGVEYPALEVQRSFDWPTVKCLVSAVAVVQPIGSE